MIDACKLPLSLNINVYVSMTSALKNNYYKIMKVIRYYRICHDRTCIFELWN